MDDNVKNNDGDVMMRRTGRKFGRWGCESGQGCGEEINGIDVKACAQALGTGTDLGRRLNAQERLGTIFEKEAIITVQTFKKKTRVSVERTVYTVMRVVETTFHNDDRLKY